MQRLITITNPYIAIALFFLVLTFVFYSGIYLYIGTLDAKREYTETSYWFPVVPSDSSDYARIADNLLENGVFSTSKEEPFIPEIHWPIGYPGFLAATKFISEGFTFAVIIQITLIAFAAYLMFRMGERFVPRIWAFIPPLLFVSDPSIAYYTVTIHSDAFFTALIVGLTYGMFFSTWTLRRRYLPFLLLGGLLGFATLVRPISQFLLILFPVGYIALNWDRQKLPIYFKSSALFVLSFFIVISPWLMRNHEVMGVYALADVGPKNLLFYNAKYFLIEKAIAERDSHNNLEKGGYADVTEAEMVETIIRKDLDERLSKEGGKEFEHYTPLALSYIFEDPVAYTKFHLVNTLPYFLAGSMRHFWVSAVGPFKERAGFPYPEHTNIANHISTLLSHGNITDMFIAIRSLSFVLIEILFRGLLVLFALVAIFIKDTQKRKYIILLWFLTLYFAVLTGPVSFTRYRIVTEPYLLILAIAGLGLFTEIVKKYIYRLRGKDIHMV